MIGIFRALQIEIISSISCIVLLEVQAPSSVFFRQYPHFPPFPPSYYHIKPVFHYLFHYLSLMVKPSHTTTSSFFTSLQVTKEVLSISVYVQVNNTGHHRPFKDISYTFERLYSRYAIKRKSGVI